tara:strand:- start:3287 stop:3601 length:315 start_codon:yes stop_codon:yes gene_type:complete
MANENKEKEAEVKPGWKTTEFWLNLLVVILGAVLASGAIGAGGLTAQIIGGALSVLGALGHTASRTSVKTNAAGNATALSALLGNAQNDNESRAAAENPSKESA